jgi:hypothetical protein
MHKLSLATLALMITAGTAHADARHYYPADACEVAYGEDQVLFWDDGGAYNAASTWWRTLMCPTPIHGGRYISAFVVRAYDRSYTQDVSCRFVYSTDGYTGWGTAASTNGSSTLPITIAPPGGTGRIETSLLCYLPQTYQGNRSGLLGYTYDVVPW